MQGLRGVKVVSSRGRETSLTDARVSEVQRTEARAGSAMLNFFFKKKKLFLLGRIYTQLVIFYSLVFIFCFWRAIWHWA